MRVWGLKKRGGGDKIWGEMIIKTSILDFSWRGKITFFLKEKGRV